LDGPSNEWQEGPGLVASIWRYRWLVAVAVLVGGLTAYLWSSRQPVRYEGEVRVFLNTGGDENADPGRVVRSQAEYLTSPAVVDRAIALTNNRLTPRQLRDRLTVEPATDADLITIKVLEATPQAAAQLADTVVDAYRKVLSDQTVSGAKQEIARLEARQNQLGSEIKQLDQQLRDQPGDPILESRRTAKRRELDGLSIQIEDARRSARNGPNVETVRERAAVPDEPAQPKPLRAAAVGALLAFFAAAGLAWWLNGRRPALERQAPSQGLDLSSPVRLPARIDEGRGGPSNGLRAAGNGSISGIADFDQIASSVQELFRFLDGPSQRLYEEDLPQLAVEEITHRFQVDMAAILLDNAGEVQTMGSVGLRSSRTGTIDRGVRHLIETAARSGPRLVDHDELVRLSGTGLGGDEADSLALVPLVRDQIGFGVLLAGRKYNDERFMPLSEREVEDIANCARDIVPYVWAWLLLRNLKLRLRTLQ
jgi:hypothetical protein